MKLSFLFTKTTKTIAEEEKSINAQLLTRAGFIDKLMSGVYTLLPLGLKTCQKIENIIRQEIDNIGGQEIFMPSLQPEEAWQKTGRWETMDDLYKVKDKSGHEYALGPTHEEVVVPLVKKFVSSYKDLPVYVYQFQNKFRMEMRAKSGILRGREFIMKDLYSFHLTEEDLDRYYEKATQAYKNIFARAGIGDLTHLTYASGGSFAKYSHEFQTITPAGEDTIYICTKCQLAVNKEIKHEVSQCPECGGSEFREEKAIEVGNIFKLKTKYSAPFSFTVQDKDGQEKPVIMGCYGIGVGRLMGTIVEILHDEKGMIWPQEVAPFTIYLASLGNLPELAQKAEKVYDMLIKAGYEVLYDDREVSAGIKLQDADLIGLPWRIILSDKTLPKESVEIKPRQFEDVKLIKINQLIKYLAGEIKGAKI